MAAHTDSVSHSRSRIVKRNMRAAAYSSKGPQLICFGKFAVAERGPRQGVNPRTGERIFIPGGKVPRFSAGSGLKKAVKGGGGGGE